VCLANEPVYDSSGRDPVTHPAFVQFLQQKHHDIAALNALYGKTYTNFEQVPAPGEGMPATREGQRAYYDWTTFNNQMFADWHKWMDSVLKREGLKAPTHTKIMVFQCLDRDKLHYGLDPELMCDTTDLAGCDNYAFYGGGGYAYDWMQNEFFYDLLHSFRGQSVFNSENHVIPDGAGPSHIPMNHTRAVLWQGGLHHQGSTTIWVWELAVDHSLAGSIYFRPANVLGAGMAMEDLNRLGHEVAAINQAKPTVALLYSQPSVFWQQKYQGTIYSLYTALNFLGENVTFISERQLAKDTGAKVPWLVVPNASHMLDTTPAGLERFTRSGGKVLLVGKECLQKDEYDRPFAQKADDFPTVELAGSEEATAGVLREAMKSAEFDSLRDAASGKPAWGIEFRVVRQRGYVLVPMINFNKESKTVSFASWGQRQARDLVNGEDIKLDSIILEPMAPRLVKVRE
ncbi:MAG: beta-galactosidase, partial [Limisphaerales bacterium]